MFLSVFIINISDNHYWRLSNFYINTLKVINNISDNINDWISCYYIWLKY